MQPALLELPDAQQITGLINTWATASHLFLAALRSSTSTAEALARLGMRLCKEERAMDAVPVLRAAVALEPTNASFWVNLAVALDRTGGAAEAAVCLERSLSLSQQQPATWLLLGNIKTKLTDLAGAEAAYHMAVRLDDKSPLGWQCLGLVKQEQGDCTAALDCFTNCLDRGGATPPLLANIGKLCYQTGRIADSHQAYIVALSLDKDNAGYLQMLRRTQFLESVLNGSSVDEALTVYQESLPADAPAIENDLTRLLEGAFRMLSGFGHVDAATRVGRKWLELSPGNATAEYLLKAVSGGQGVDRSPTAYLVEYFDGFAADFDGKLVKTLHYDVPAKLCAAIKSVVGPDRRFDTLDIGCGTGLCGPLLKPIARELIGVDLSPKMLEQAQRRGVYDDLCCEELVAFLQRVPGRFDLIVAADVLLYFGDLYPVWIAAKRGLRPGGLLAFSTELSANDGYHLQKSGRFAHSLAYVRSTIQEMFEELLCAETTLRQEAMQPVSGIYYVMKRR